jgi:acetyltransferase-like isoleucine patch superfamily enzyme
MLKSPLMLKISTLFRRLVQSPRILLFHLMSSNDSDGKPICYQPLQLTGNGTIKFDLNVRIGVFPSPMFFSTYAYIEARNSDASVHVGENTWINNNFTAIAEHTSITIGANCLIGSNVEILDSDFHGMKISERRLSRPESAASVVIGNDVFIGNNAVILKGVTVGDGAVISNRALVVSDVPARTIVGGVPAKFIRAIE